MSTRYSTNGWLSATIACLALLGVYAAVSSQAQDQSVSSLNGPTPLSDTMPSSEAITPVIGTSSMAMRADARLPRITRATTVVTDATGSFSGTWTTPLAAAPTISLTPIASAASIDCQLTSAPTTTTFAGRCYSSQTTTLNLSIVTVGLSLNPVTTTPAGVSVQVIALPPTQ